MTTTLGTTLSDTAIDEGRVPEKDVCSLSFGTRSINGTTYTDAMNAQLCSSPDPGRIEIDAGRDFGRFQGDLGVPDDEPSDSVYEVQISLDNGAPVFSSEIRFGEIRKIDLDVTEVLRIKIAITPLSRSRVIAIGNPRLS